jgi:pimeloyl-ACP methyl ester carboxylesterase
MNMVLNAFRLLYRALKDAVWNVSFYVCELIFLAGAAAKIKVSPADLQRRMYQLNRTALNSPSLSVRTMIYLKEWGLLVRWRRQPLDVLRELDQRLKEQPEPELLGVLIELTYLFAELRRKFSLTALMMYSSCCFYAYTCLFDSRYREMQNPYRQEFHMVCDFYNRSLSIILQYIFRKKSRMARPIHLPLLDGALTIETCLDQSPWPLDMIRDFHISNEYVLRGMRDYTKVQGLGAPVFITRSAPDVPSREETYMPRNTQIYALTSLLHISREENTGQGSGISYSARLHLYDPLKTDVLEIDGKSVAMAKDLSTPIGFLISAKPMPTGFKGMLNIGETVQYQGLYMLQPYQKGRIPVVLVHGLMSTPLTWLSLFNYFLNDPVLRERYQFWFYMYPTGNPILHSGYNLRKTLLEIQRFYDPDGNDPAFNRMVIVGHSMGGIISKMLVQSSGDDLWRGISEQQLDELDFTPEHQMLLKNLFFFEPLPFITRIIFIATPHEGARFSQSPLGRLGAFSVKLHEDFLLFGKEVKRLIVDRTRKTSELFNFYKNIKRIPTGIDGLRPENPTLKIMAQKPIARHVTYHSIIGNHEAAGTPSGSDRVVPYESAHIDGAASEVIIKSSHGVHARPQAVREIQRILKEHLGPGMQ